MLVDQSSQHITSFSLQNITIGNRLLINLLQDNGSAIATKLVRVDANGNTGVSVEGPADAAIADPVFSITGIPVNTINLPDIRVQPGRPDTADANGLFSCAAPRHERQSKRTALRVDAGTRFGHVVVLLQLHDDRFGGNVFGGANDVIFTWDGTLYTDPLTQTTPNISLMSATPTPFFGFPWTVHDARAFGPGSYSFDTGNGTPLNLEVGPDQVGAHLLFDWNIFPDIDMVLLGTGTPPSTGKSTTVPQDRYSVWPRPTATATTFASPWWTDRSSALQPTSI